MYQITYIYLSIANFIYFCTVPFATFSCFATFLIDPPCEHWDDLLGLIATIKLKLTPASQIFKRLTSYAKQHALYQALKAFGQINKTQFILEYIDDVELRQAMRNNSIRWNTHINLLTSFFMAITRSLPRQLKKNRKKPRHANDSFKTPLSFGIISAFQKSMDEKDNEKRQQVLKTIKSGSIVTWAHIHLHGEYDFSENKLKDSVGFNMSQILALKISENWDMEKSTLVLH